MQTLQNPAKKTRKTSAFRGFFPLGEARFFTHSWHGGWVTRWRPGLEEAHLHGKAEEASPEAWLKMGFHM